jgi:hypothetical protein
MPITPPAYLQAGTYSALMDRQYLTTTRMYRNTTTSSRARGGLLPGPANQSAALSTSLMTATVGPYAAVVENGSASNAGDYEVVSVANETVTLAASSPTTNRIDVVGILVEDAFYSGSNNAASLVVIQGAPSAGAPVVPTVPANFEALYRGTVNANVTTPTWLDVRRRTGPAGSTISNFLSQNSEVGSYVGERRTWLANGNAPTREVFWGEDNTWHGVNTYALTFPAFTAVSSGADRLLSSLTVQAPGYPYRIVFDGQVVLASDPDAGFITSVRVGSSAGTQYGYPAYQQNRQAVFTGANSFPITGSSPVLTGTSPALQVWLQRNFGSGAVSVDANSGLTALVVPA